MYIYIIRLKFVLGNFILPSTGFQISLYIYKNGRTDERWTIYITTRTKERADELTNRLLTNRRKKTSGRSPSFVHSFIHPSNSKILLNRYPKLFEPFTESYLHDVPFLLFVIRIFFGVYFGLTCHIHTL